MKKQIPLTPVLAAAILIVALAGWFALVSPKRAQSAALDEEIADYETKVMLASQPKPGGGAPSVRIDAADLFRLAKAMPDREDMPGVILELDTMAVSTGVRFMSILPGAPVTYEGYYAVPVTLEFQGNYYDLTDFLFRLRSLVRVHDGVLDATGRLYTLDSLEFRESEGGFPQIQARLVLSAYSFGVPVDPAAPPPPPGEPQGGETESGETETSETETGETQTTESGGGDAAPAGGTP